MTVLDRYLDMQGRCEWPGARTACTTLRFKVYRDTPKRGETDAKWCWYETKPNGPIGKAEVGYETEEEAYEAAFCACK